GKRVEQGGDRAHQRRVIGAGQVGAADAALEEDVAGEDRVAGRVRDVVGTVAGRGDDVEGEAGELERVAAVNLMLRRVRLERPEAGPAHVVVDVLEDLDLAGRA